MWRKQSGQTNNTADALFLYVGKIISLISVFLWLALCRFCTEHYIKKRLPCYDPVSFPFHPQKIQERAGVLQSKYKRMCFTSALVCFVVITNTIRIQCKMSALLQCQGCDSPEWGGGGRAGALFPSAQPSCASMGASQPIRNTV